MLANQAGLNRDIYWQNGLSYMESSSKTTINRTFMSQIA